MSDRIAAPTREQFRQPGAGASLLDQVIAATGQFDPDAWHVMDRRDSRLIEDELMNGRLSNKFFYRFDIPGSGTVTGISVVGARHLASFYGGLKHRLVATTRKKGALFVFQSYPHEGVGMQVTVQKIPDLEGEDDFYTALVQIEDIKTGNTVQVEATEQETKARSARKGGGTYENPHAHKIAQAKAYRNGVLAVIPQDVRLGWQVKLMEMEGADSKSIVITDDLLGEKRDQVMRFAAAKGVALDPTRVQGLTMNLIAGISQAAHEGRTDGFARAAESLGLMRDAPADDTRTTVVMPAVSNGQAAPAGSGQANGAASPTTSAERKPEPARQASGAKVAAPAQGAEQPPFEAFPADAYGEPVEMDGKGHFTDPLAFAEAIYLYVGNVPPERRQAVVENNADALSDARKASAEAAKVIDALPELIAPDAAPAPLAIPAGGRGPDLAAYVLAAKGELSGLDTSDQVEAWQKLNEPTFAAKKIPNSIRLQVTKAVQDRLAAIAGQSTARVTAPDHDADLTQQRLAEIAALPDRNAVFGYRQNMIFVALVDRFRRDRPDLAARIEEALAAREREVAAVKAAST